LACMSRDFDIFMSKHLAGQWLLNSYFSLYYSFTESLTGLPIRSHILAGGPVIIITERFQ
jgi:hypothetical protein